MFVAKCIQDGRRVDLPLSTPFFKLMCTPVRRDLSQDGSKDSLEGGDSSPGSSPFPEPVFTRSTELLKDNDDNRESNRRCEDNCSNHGSSGNENSSEASRQRSLHGEAGLKEAELVLSTHADEISKDGSPKEEVVASAEGEGSWFDSILKRGDLDVVSPYRSRFLRQLGLLVKQRDEIQGNSQLGSLEKEGKLAGLTLSGAEENIPGAKLEDLWYVLTGAGRWALIRAGSLFIEAAWKLGLECVKSWVKPVL